MLRRSSRLAALPLLWIFSSTESSAEAPPSHVDPSEVSATGEPVRARPLPWLGKVCSPTSLPRLSGGWIFGCNSSGRPTKALSVLTGDQVEFSPPQGAWGLSQGTVLDLEGKIAFTPEGEEVQLTPISSSVHAPLISSSKTLVFSGERGIETMRMGSNTRTLLAESTPAPWYPPALNNHGVFWVHLQNGKEEIHWQAHTADQPEPFATDNQPLRHVVGDGDHVAWMSDTAVYLRNLTTGATQETSGAVHSNNSLALSGDLVCYEAFADEDLDIFCNNGFHLERPGHQRSPSIWRDWLVFHEGEQALLYGPIK